MTELKLPMVIEDTIKLRITVTKIGGNIPTNEVEDFKNWVVHKANDISTGNREEYKLLDDPKDDFPVEFTVEVL